MALYFHEAGWRDITVAHPVNILEADGINSLAEKADLNLIADCPSSVIALDALLSAPVGMWMKVDSGYERAGVSFDNADEARLLLDAISRSKSMTFKGLLAHSGHTYAAGSPDEISDIHIQSVERLSELRASLGLEGCEISVGDTPSASLVEDLSGADEIRPGNFVFYDLMQHALGACSEYDIALGLACPVVSVRRSRIVLYGGAVHLSKEVLRRDEGVPVYGCLFAPGKDSLGGLDRDMAVVSLSQEHAVIRPSGRAGPELRPGDVVVLAPVHSCLTAACHPKYLTMDGTPIPRMHYF
jgi:D-serine deaminase-like pyridoxal phosphate-dependent protein